MKNLYDANREVIEKAAKETGVESTSEITEILETMLSLLQQAYEDGYNAAMKEAMEIIGKELFS